MGAAPAMTTARAGCGRTWKGAAAQLVRCNWTSLVAEWLGTQNHYDSLAV